MFTCLQENSNLKKKNLILPYQQIYLTEEILERLGFQFKFVT